MKDDSASATPPAIDRVAAAAHRAGQRTAETFAKVQQEILQEMAGALGRAEEKVVRAIARLEELDATGAPDRAWHAQKKAAEVALWEYLVHRDAMGLRGQETAIRAKHPIPTRRRTVR